jgi:hypothetical protein
MVVAVRQGQSQRAVARAFGVSLRTVQVWLARASDVRLDRIDWGDRPVGCRHSPHRTPAETEAHVLALRTSLRLHSPLGEYGAAAIQRALVAGGAPRVPSVRTIGRILERHGALDGQRRLRHAPPPRGWHLPLVAAHQAELDLVDVLEDLKLAGGPLVEVLTTVSLHGGLPGAWPLCPASTDHLLPCLAAHWRQFGCPAYAQFDNDTRFQGPHQHRDVFGRCVRFCLQLGITPVFVPPREFGLQNAVEHFNGLYVAKVWQRFHYASLEGLGGQTAAYLAARRARLALRIAHAPPRRPWPGRWTFDPSHLPAARVVFIRRTSASGTIHLLGHQWPVDPHWCHRLVRAELDLGTGAVHCFALRRRAPAEQPLLAVLAYEYPRGDLSS